MPELAVTDAKTDYFFPTPVISAMIADCDDLNKRLKEVIEKNRAASSGLARSNILGWHSDTEMLRWGGEPAKDLALATLQLCGAHVTDVGTRNNQPRYQMAMEMWANASPPGASNQYHCHPGCVWSGVYFVDDGGDPESRLTLIDPNYPTNAMNAPDLQFVGDNGERLPRTQTFSPTPGRLVLFPSWLNHAVKPNTGDRDRISIAMNIMATPAAPAW